MNYMKIKKRMDIFFNEVKSEKIVADLKQLGYQVDYDFYVPLKCKNIKVKAKIKSITKFKPKISID